MENDFEVIVDSDDYTVLEEDDLEKDDLNEDGVSTSFSAFTNCSWDDPDEDLLENISALLIKNLSFYNEDND